VPFAALVALGGAFGTRARAPILQRNVTIVLEVVGQPFSGGLPVLPGPPALPRQDPSPDRLAAIAGFVWLTGAIAVLAIWLVRCRRVAAIVRASTRVNDGPELAALRRLERRAGLVRSIEMVASPAPLEPGVFGVFRPVLIWPASIGAHLNPDQLVTILSHEIAHVRRRDNLAAAIQTVAEAIFWFHPLVWWIGARLVEERERACDEDVMRAGGEPSVYAETILTACRVFLEAPRACVAGVTGSDLKKRIERIMCGAATRGLATSSRLLLTTGAIATLLVPIGVGAVNAPRARVRVSSTRVNQLRAVFEVAAVKPNKSGPGPVRIQTSPGGRFTATNVTVKNLIQFAYRLQPFQVVGGPDWLNSNRFDIVAKGDESDDGNQFLTDQQSERPSRVQQRVQSLLADRFRLMVRTETTEQPMYWLVLARSDGRLGPALRQSTVDCSIEKERSAQNVVKVPLENASQPPCGIRMSMGSILVGGATLSQFAGTLAGMVDRTVLDHTGLAGTFDATLRFTPDQSTPGFAEKARYIPSIDPDGPSIFTALQEQLGLRLDSRKGQVDVLRIVSADQPTPN